MAPKRKRYVASPRRQPPAEEVVITDRLWVWTKRGATAAVAVGGVLWYVFQFYAQVQGLKDRVEALWAGQSTIMQTLDALKTSIANLPQNIKDNNKK